MVENLVNSFLDFLLAPVIECTKEEVDSITAEWYDTELEVPMDSWILEFHSFPESNVSIVRIPMELHFLFSCRLLIYLPSQLGQDSGDSDNLRSSI